LAPNGVSIRCLINEVALDDVDRVSPRHVIEAVVVAHNHADAVATLKNLSQDVQAQKVMQEEGVVDFLKPLIQGPESWIKTQAIAVLQNLGVDFTAHESGAPKAANEPPADAQGRSAQQNIKSSTARLSPQMKFHGQKANAGAGARSEYLLRHDK
jgi:hypothetical protein